MKRNKDGREYCLCGTGRVPYPESIIVVLGFSTCTRQVDVENLVQDEGMRLLAALASLCTRENTDVTIECGEEKFYCHSILLKARSDMFLNLLENGNNAVRVDGVRPDIMNQVIK